MTEGQRATGVEVLDRIVAAKVEEVAGLRSRRSELVRLLADAPPPRPVLDPLATGSRVGVFAEVKRRSPAAGDMDRNLDPVTAAGAYASGGAFAISVLTDRQFFGGRLEDLTEVRSRVPVPVLRKDFVIDELQVVEARGAGADLVLLIARLLESEALARLHEAVEGLGMTALVEVHHEDEVGKALDAGARLVGINNRDLSTFMTDLSVTSRIAPQLPSRVLVVSESGIRGRQDVEAVARAGVDAVLVGEALVRSPDRAAAVSAMASVPRTSRHEGP